MWLGWLPIQALHFPGPLAPDVSHDKVSPGEQEHKWEVSFGGQEFPTKHVNEVGLLVVMLMDLDRACCTEWSKSERG